MLSVISLLISIVALVVVVAALPTRIRGRAWKAPKVEIAVTSNQDPARVARLVYQELQNLRGHPKITPSPCNSGPGSGKP